MVVTPLPVLEVDGSQTVANPFVEFPEDARGVCQVEIFFPSQQIAAQPAADLFDASAARPPRYETDVLLHRRQSFARHPTLNG